MKYHLCFSENYQNFINTDLLLILSQFCGFTNTFISCQISPSSYVVLEDKWNHSHFLKDETNFRECLK